MSLHNDFFRIAVDSEVLAKRCAKDTAYARVVPSTSFDAALHYIRGFCLSKGLPVPSLYLAVDSTVAKQLRQVYTDYRSLKHRAEETRHFGKLPTTADLRTCLEALDRIRQATFGELPPAASEPDHSAFISHRSTDKAFAEMLGRSLLEHGIDVWFDAWEIYAGDSIPDKIEEGFRRSDVVLLVLSPNYLQGKWSKQEYLSFISEAISKGKKRVIPVVYKPCDVPALVADRRRVDFSSGTDYDTRISELAEAILRVRRKPHRKDGT